MNTDVCEQTFFGCQNMGKMTRKMNKGHFVFFRIYVQDLHNNITSGKRKNYETVDIWLLI